MSDPEAFLARWSRRKRAAEEESEAVPSGVPQTKSEAQGAPDEDGTATPQGEAKAEPAVDLSSLPSLESITAETDIRSFLAAGVPDQMRAAALRRAWAADPAIRDFVGLSDYAWDFNTADSMPGFGALSPTDAIRALAQLMGNTEQNPTQTILPGEGQPGEPAALLLENKALLDQASATGDQSDVGYDFLPTDCPTDEQSPHHDHTAAQNLSESADRVSSTRLPHAHGGAIPQ